MSGDLRISGVTYVLSRTLLEDIDLDFRAGEVTALSGPSGSGKTTLLSVAGGLIEPTRGSASYDGRPMWQGTGDPRPEVAFVLQDGLHPPAEPVPRVECATVARALLTEAVPMAEHA